MNISLKKYEHCKNIILKVMVYFKWELIRLQNKYICSKNIIIR